MGFIFLGYRYGISRKGEDCVTSWYGSYEPIVEEKQCKEYAKIYGYAFKTETESGYPKNCYLHNNYVYFNKHSTGNTESNSKKICRKS